MTPQGGRSVLGKLKRGWHRLKCLRHYDYTSPGLHALPTSIEAYFPHMKRRRPFNLRVPHTGRVDQRYPSVGWVTWDEALLLYNYGLELHNTRFLEIGCWVGFSTVALGLSGTQLVVIDPVLDDEPQGEACRDSLRRAELTDSIRLVGGFSPDAIRSLADEGVKWRGFFVDGNHEAEAPLLDVQECVEHAEEDAVIILHDLVQPNVANALRWLANEGWNIGLHCTAQMMGVAWRGNTRPIRHIPDPRVAWDAYIREEVRHLSLIDRL